MQRFHLGILLLVATIFLYLFLVLRFLSENIPPEANVGVAHLLLLDESNEHHSRWPNQQTNAKDSQKEHTHRLNCHELRGRWGQWEYSKEFAINAQYRSTLKEQAGDADRLFTPSIKEPFRPATAWKWNETVFPVCAFKIVSLRGMCDLLERMGIARLFFVGDSLSFMMVQSLWKLLGFLDDPGSQFGGFDRFVQCSRSNFRFQISFYRNDHLDNATYPLQGSGWPKCRIGEGLCWPWIDEYLSYSKRTLFVANTGLHTHQHEHFRRDFDAFVDLIEDIRPPDDIILFRTSVPGHAYCDRSSVPYSNYSEYSAAQTPMYDWEKVEGYNEYAEQKVLRRDTTPVRAGSPMGLLDVAPMTLLRPDGHRPPDDCLHYYLPGPPDWWNHLLYSNLLDLSLTK